MREGSVRLWLTCVVVWRKPMQYCEAIILQLKMNFLKKAINLATISWNSQSQGGDVLFLLPCSHSQVDRVKMFP